MTICTVHEHDFFRAKARLEPDKSWKDVLDSRKTRQEECLGVASVITFACSHISRSDFEMTLIEGYVHGDANIRLGSLKRWLPMNHRELPELLEIEFEAILPGRKQHNQVEPTIHTASHYSKFSRRNRERMVGGR